MPVFNNPAYGRAAENIAAMFAPPSSGDQANFALARQRNQEAAMIAELYRNAQTPEEKHWVANLYDPSQGLTAFREGEATKLATNTADNTRAVTTNAADNARAFATAMFGNLGQGELRPQVPGDIAGLFSLPALPAVQGAPKPLSATEVEGGILAGLPDAEQRAVATKGIDLAEIVTPQGPRNVFSIDAVGQEPFINKGAEAALQTENYRGPNGENGTAYFEPTTREWFDTATKQPVPSGSVTYTGQLSGDAASTGLGPTTANMTEANRLAATLDATEASITRYEALLENNPGIAGVPGAMMGAAQNAVQSLNEITQAFGDKAPNAAVTLDEVRAGLQQFAPNYDPNIQRARVNAAELAYQWAQIQNPSGEVSRQAYERALEALTGGMFRNNASALSGVQGFRDAIASKRIQVDSLRTPQAGAAPANPAPGQVPTVNTPEEAAQLPSGTQFRTPDGRLMEVP